MRTSALPILLALACCTPPLTQGHVAEKAHTHAQLKMIAMPTCDGRETHLLMVPVCQPEEWSLRIVATGDDGESRSQWVLVTQSVWESLQTGDYWFHGMEGRK